MPDMCLNSRDSLLSYLQSFPLPGLRDREIGQRACTSQHWPQACLEEEGYVMGRSRWDMSKSAKATSYGTRAGDQTVKAASLAGRGLKSTQEVSHTLTNTKARQRKHV